MDKISLQDCFSLGQAIREGDAELFLALYDEFKGVKDEELLILKETSRQISDLSTPLFSILHSKHIEKCLTNIEITPLPIDLIDICNNLNHNVMSDSGVCSDDFEIEQDEKKEILLSINTEKVNEQSKCDNGLSKRIISKRVQRRVLSERKPSCQPSSPCGLDQSRHYKTDLYTDHSSRKNRTLQHSVNRGNAGGFDHEKAVEFLSKRWNNVKKKMK